ncbi:MAG TPA: LysM peptidoglycan-binding domain-containing protein [Bacillota bacterium]|nr:LysM peptidoglycan-binding domain-containing protein [Bacillota bacterium]
MGKIKKIALIGTIALSIAAAGGGTALADTVHVVSPGDTYWKISQWYGVDLTALLNANGANGNSVLYVGQRVTIPGENAGYIVKAGDTYWIISQKMNVDMNELLALNGANTGSVLYKGQSIKLPSSVKTHTVKQGETFWLISNAYGISMQSLMKANDASAGTVLYPGMVLYVPPVKGGAYTPPSRGGRAVNAAAADPAAAGAEALCYLHHPYGTKR